MWSDRDQWIREEEKTATYQDILLSPFRKALEIMFSWNPIKVDSCDIGFLHLITAK